MYERRQAFRREPIEVQLDETTVISVAPVPWQQRNDFGNEVVNQHVEILNNAVRMYIDADTGLPQLEAKMGEKFSDPDALFKLGLLPETYSAVKSLDLYHNQIVEILLAICDVNDVAQLKAMIDPNLTTPTKLGGILSGLIEPEADTQSPESGPDSLLGVSEEKLLETSPTQS